MAANTTVAAVVEAATESSVFSDLDSKFALFTVDPLAALQSIPVQTVAIVGVSILMLVFAIDLIGYLVALYHGTTYGFVPYSRSVAHYAANAWDNRNEPELVDYYKPFENTEAIERMTPVLNNLSKAVHKWQ